MQSNSIHLLSAVCYKLGLLKAHSSQMDKALFKEAQESFSGPLDN